MVLRRSLKSKRTNWERTKLHKRHCPVLNTLSERGQRVNNAWGSTWHLVSTNDNA